MVLPFGSLLGKDVSFIILPIVTLLCGNATAQHGPFGIGNATGSDGQPKLLLWLDGSTPSVSVESNVLIWPDKSGNGNDFTAAPTTSPVLKASGPNGRPYLLFAQENNRMTLANLEFENQGVSIFYVFRTADANYGMFSLAESNANPYQVLVRQSGGQNRFSIQSTEHLTNIGNLSNNTWRYAGFVWDGVSNPTYWHRSSGTGAPEVTQDNILSGLNTATSGTAVIGHIQNLLNGGFDIDESFQGELAEIFVYDGKVNRAMLRQINTYFRNKYGVGGTGAWDKLNAPPTHREGLIGIARDNGSNSEHRHSRADGLVLRANPGGIQGNHSYLSAGHAGVVNSVVNSHLPAGVEARWLRDWFIRKEGMANGSDIQIAFDFGEGINGDFPLNASNYVLLYRSGTSGNYSVRAVSETFIQDKEVVFRLSGSQIPGNGYYTLGTTDNVLSNLTGQLTRTWYAYQSGFWSNPTTWTLDGSAAPTFVNPGGAIPASGDAVVIGSGRAVACDLNARVHSSLSLFGSVDFGSTNGHNMGAIGGNGLIKCAGASGVSNFPLGNTSAFADPITGGQVEFYGSGFVQNQDLELNRLRINLTSAGATITYAANLLHNGLFEINQGTFQLNNTASLSRTVESAGDVLIESQGRIRISTTNRNHTWTFHGDLVNQGGDMRFTNRTSPNYGTAESQGHAFTRFVNNTRNQAIVADGISYFSRIVLNKGTDATYILTISSDSPDQFGLFGNCNSGMGDASFYDEGSGAQSTSVALINGTLEIRENIFLPLQTGAGNYNINHTAMLWVNGGFAAKGAPDVGTGNNTAIVPYGTIRVSAGTLNANCNSGITTRGNGVLQVDGGEVNANQIRTSVFGPSNVGGIIINGGSVNVDGTRPGGASSSYYTFSLTYPGNLFRMTGGELYVAGPTSRGLIFINSDPEQTSVSGGTMIAEVKNTSTNHRLSSRAAFWNLEVRRTDISGTNRPIVVSGGDSFGEIIDDQPLFVRNALRITGANNATLRMRSVSNNDLDAHVQGNFVIENGGVYDHQNNTTWFDGNSSSILSLPTSAAQSFHHVVVNKNADDRFAEIQGGNTTMAMEVLGEFRVERGYFNNSNRHVNIYGHVVNRNAFGVESATGTIFLRGSSAQELLSDNGIFHNLTIDNPFGVSLINDDLRVRRTMQLLDGNFFINSHKLRVESSTGSINVSSPSSSRCFVTDGSASAGGLEIIYRTASQNTIFPLGVLDGTTIKYVPALTVVNGNYESPGYVRIVPVNEVLPTADMSSATDYLNFYWKVAHSDFEVLPLVSHRFEYLSSDVTGNANNLASGRILFDAPFDRQIDSLTSASDHVNTASHWIFYNGADVAQNSLGAGLTLCNASYSAGNKEIFFGRPRVFFSRNSTLNAVFGASANWNELGQFGPGDGVFEYHGTGVSGNALVPLAGDIVFIGFDPSTGRPHSYEVPVGGVTASEIRFTPMQNHAGDRLPRWNGTNVADITVLRPTLSFSTTAHIENIKTISGEGTLLMRGNVDLSVVDMGDFLKEDSSIVMVQATANINLDYLPAVLPNLFLTTSNNGSNALAMTPTKDVQVRGNLEVAGNAKLRLSTGLEGDIEVGNKLQLAKYQAATSAPEVQFGNLGAARRLKVDGDLIINGNGARLQVLGPNSFAPQVIHELIVGKNIIQHAPASTGLNLFTSINNDYVALTLTGDGNHVFLNTAGNAPQLGRILVDKGSNRSSGFAFNSLINVNAPANGEVKPIEVRNGLLSINHSSTNIVLSSGGPNYNIPGTAGIALANGTLRINGSQNGLILAGLLKIDGGLFEIGNAADQNNYIEYSSGGQAAIEVTGGQLNVGSQIRRGLTNTQGVLDFRQSGGIVRVGIHDAPNVNRGVFEITNPGSRFDLTGGEFVLVRGVNSTSTPSLLLEPAVSNVHPSALITIGSNASPAGAAIKNIGIKSNIAIPALNINNGSGNDPVVKLYTSPLTIEDMLEIGGGATLETQFLDLVVKGDILNNGLLKSNDGKLILDHSSLNNVGGTGTYDLNQLERIGGGVTICNTDLLVKGDLTLDDGVLSMGAHILRARRNVIVDGHVQFASGEGLVMEGTGNQILRRSTLGLSSIDILTIDNPSGINQVAGQGHVFEIGKALRMKRGIFNLNGNLLELGTNTEVVQVNAFGQNNMISTGGSFTNFGVRKALAANSNQDVFIPLGLDKYMPVRLIFSDVGYSSGSAPSSYLFKLNQPSHPVVIDPNNVLQMYFSLEAANVGSNLRMDMELIFDESYIATTGTNEFTDYIGARVVDANPTPSVFKFLDAVNPTMNLLNFSFNNVTADGISGDYFAGIEEAIPDNVPVYTTVRNGLVNEGQPSTGTYDQEVPGGGAPNGAVVKIVDDHILNLNINGITLYKTIIEEGATLEIASTTFHRLGIVEGTGTIRLVNSGSLPSGIYNEFFTCTGGRLEFAGSSGYEILAGLPIVRSVRLSGTGNRTLANNDVQICEDLEINGPVFVNGNLASVTVGKDLIINAGTFNSNQGELDVEGDLLLSGTGSFTSGNQGRRSFHGDIVQSGGSFNVGTGGFNEIKGNFTRTGGSMVSPSGSARMIFNSNFEQFIQGDFSGSNALRIAEIDNPEGLRLHNNVDISLRLELSSGNVISATDSLLRFANTNVTAVPATGSPASFVAGPMEWVNLNTSGNRIFPVGKGARHRPLTLSVRSHTRTWTVEYYDTTATMHPGIASLDPVDPFTIKTVSKQEYWRVNSNIAAATNARVGLSWGENSAVAEEPGDYDKLVVLHWDGSNAVWQNAGANSSTFNYDPINEVGSFISQSAVGFSERFFTLGSTDAVNPLPVTWLYFAGTSDGKDHTLSWATASEINNDFFELERSIDGRNFVPIARVDGSGNSNTRLDYGYVDRLAPAGRVYYRIRQVDFNGDFEYAEEIVTLVKDQQGPQPLDFLLYPNPTSTGKARLLISDFNAEMAIISLSELSGKVLLRKAVWIDEQGVSDEITCDFPTGVYIVSVLHNGAMRSKPLIINQ